MIGMTFGRLFGGWFVTKGRKLCLYASAVVDLLAIGVMMVEDVRFLIGGRLVVGFGIGIFNSVGVRFVEECSPP